MAATNPPHASVREAPLEGLRIVEIATYIAGPSCGLVLAQLGADVIRVDPIGGAADFTRLPLAPNGTSLYWQGLNHGKRSVEIDTRTPEGQKLVLDLLGVQGDGNGILLTNRANVDWLSFDRLQQTRRDVVIIHIEGTHDGASAVDYTVNAEVGVPMVTGPTNASGPVNHVLPAWDLLAGLQAAIAILAAERSRSRSGAGQQIRLALGDVALASLSNLGFFSDAILSGDSRRRDGNFIYGTFGVDFATSDSERVMVAALTARHWSELVAVTDTGAVISAIEATFNADFRKEGSRFEHRDLLAAVLRPWFASRTLASVRDAFEGRTVLWAPYYDVVRLLREPTSLYNRTGIFQTVNVPDIGVLPIASSVLRSDQWDLAPLGAPPALGEHTGQILRDVLGLSDARIADLRARSIVGNASGVLPGS